MPHHRGKRTAAPKAQLAADQHVFDLGPSRRRRLARALVPGRGGGVFREKSRRGGFCFALLHVNCRRRRSPCPSGPSSRHAMPQPGTLGNKSGSDRQRVRDIIYLRTSQVIIRNAPQQAPCNKTAQGSAPALVVCGSLEKSVLRGWARLTAAHDEP